MTTNKKYIIGGIIVHAAIIAMTMFTNKENIVEYAFQPTDTSLKTLTLPEGSEEIVAQDLLIPWEIVFLPDNNMLVTERGGRLKHIASGKIIPVEGVSARGEGGLLGMALHPNFESNNFIYLYFTTQASNGLQNRVIRYTYKNETLSAPQIVIDNIPGNTTHDGGRIAFGPDRMLYITTGDAGNEESAQNTQSLSGKILRITDSGSIPADNPFGNAVYSYGHRNPQGIAWDNTGQLWATEHGRSGARSGFDELNKIIKSANYGWPTIEGDETQPNLQSPAIHSTAAETWAPGGLAYVQGNLIFTGLRGASLYTTLVTNGTTGELTTYLRNKYGRLRTVVLGPDGYLYIATNNTDGRGTKKPNDDKIIRIKPSF